MMKRLLILLFFCSSAYGHTWTSTQTTDTPNQGRLKFNDGIANYVPGKRVDTIGLSVLTRPMLVLQGDTVWVVKNGVSVGVDSGYVTFMRDGDSLTSVKKTDLLRSIAAMNNSIMRPVFNVKSFGATGDGITDDGANVQRAIDSAAYYNGVVYVPVGTYIVSRVVHPVDTLFKCGIVLRSNSLLIGDGEGRTIIKKASGQVAEHMIITNYAVSSGRDSNIVVRDITFDGNGQNNVLPAHQRQLGIHFVHVEDIYFQNVTVKNVRGSGVGSVLGDESFDFHIGIFNRVFFDNCTAIGWDSASSGFSLDHGTGGYYTNCVSYRHGIGHGFTQNNCASIIYTNCHAYWNKAYGFNCEVSKNISYVNCIAGGMSSDKAYTPFSSRDSLGNGSVGFYSLTDSFVTYNNCIAVENGNNGLVTQGSAYVTVNGGQYNYNSHYGIGFDAKSTNCVIVAKPVAFGNRIEAFAIHGVGVSNTFWPIDNTIPRFGNTTGIQFIVSPFDTSGAFVQFVSVGPTNAGIFFGNKEGQFAASSNKYVMYYDKSTDAFTFAMVERNSPNVGSVPIARIRADTTLEIKNVKVAPSSPEASWGKIYFKQNKPYAKVSSGLEYSLSSIGLGSTVIDSAKVVADTLKFYVGGTAYKAVK